MAHFTWAIQVERAQIPQKESLVTWVARIRGP
jgi:hypothetical protein